MRSGSLTQSLKRVQQRASHADLYQKVSQSLTPLLRSRHGCLEAVIVPASRPAWFLQKTIELSASFGVFLVVLCSKETDVASVAERVAKTPGGNSLIVEVSEEWSHPDFPTSTSDVAFREASAFRQSDLSAKRNIGLLLARLRGWNKVVFVDDDITSLQAGNLVRLASQLDFRQVAGMVVRRYPDNSVVCHARRLAGEAQDVFLTGAVLGVHCNSLPLSFFPDIYNEDWFFFAKEAAARELPRVGNAMQAEYDPFATPIRARREEFGDLLAEGLYALIGEDDKNVKFEEHLHAATAGYWSRFIEARHRVIGRTESLLSDLLRRDPDSARISAALNSLAAAESQLEEITPDLCVDFLRAWQDDLHDWQRFTNGVNNVGSTREAMDFLGLTTWTLAKYDDAAVDSKALWSPHALV